MTNKWHTLHPATTYVLLLLFIIIASWICDIYGVRVTDPQTGGTIFIQNLLNAEGIRWLIKHVQSNFLSFDTFGMGVVTILGIGVAEHSGFINALTRQFTKHHYNQRTIILIVIIAGVCSSVMGDIGYILLLPIAVYLFKGAKLPQQAGIIVALVSVSCGFGANILITSIEPIIVRYTQEVAELNNISQSHIGIMSNYWFSVVSMIPQIYTIYRITTKHLIPQLLKKEPVSDEPNKSLSKKEQHALRNALVFGAIYLVIVCIATFSPWGILRGVMGDLIHSPFIYGSLFIISFGIGMMGVVYGFSTNIYESDKDVIGGFTHLLKLLGNFLVISFFASQLFACISYSNLDEYLLVNAGQWFSSCRWTHPIIALFIFILLTASLNLFVTSGTHKWSVLAYFAIPILSKLSISPDIVQSSFHIGDSVNTFITPFLPYAAWVLAWLIYFDKRSSFDTLIRYTWRYSLAMFSVWTGLFILWFALKIPFGF